MGTRYQNYLKLLISSRLRPPGYFHRIHRIPGSISRYVTNASKSEPKVTVKLRKYQEECIDSVLSHVNAGQRRLGISLSTGAGKTVVFTELIDRIHAPRSRATQTLIIVHRRELVEQAARHCANAYPHKSIEIEMGSAKSSGTADITIASIWSLLSGDRLMKFHPRQFKLLIVDEAHHIVAPSYMTALRRFNLLKENLDEESPVLIGVSATLSRFDGLRLGDAIDVIVYHKDYTDLIKERWLSDVTFTTVSFRADISRVSHRPNGDFQLGQLSRAVNTAESNLVVIKAWMERASQRLSTLVFGVDIAHVTNLTAEFRRNGLDARFVTGDTPKHVRNETLEAFKRRQFPILLNCGVFTEGTDIPNIDCVLLARPTRSRNLLIQMMGRGMRTAPMKSNCHIIDLVASLQSGIVTTPTLFGLDPNSTLSEATIGDIKTKEKLQNLKESSMELVPPEAASPSSPVPTSISFMDYESVYDLIQDTAGERHIRGLSPLCWVMVGQSKYILMSGDGSYLTIEAKSIDGDSFNVMYTQRMTAEAKEASNTKSPYRRPWAIASATTFSDALHGADTFARRRFPWKVIHAGQQWRRSPATESQLAFLNRLRPMKNQLKRDDVSKGNATDQITKVKFGARGWFGDLVTQRKKRARQVEQGEKLAELRRREQVAVGPTMNS